MSHVPVVENPRRRKRRHYSAKQIAAGFGGKRHRKTRKARPRRRRSNPIAFTPNARHRRYHARPTKRWHRRHRNPSVFGGSKGLFGLPIPGVDLKSALYVGLGMASTRIVPNLVRKFLWAGLPADGYMKHLVDAGAGIAAGMVVKLVTKDSAAAGKVVAGALGMVLLNLFNEKVAPQIGLAGLTGELATVGDMGGMVDYPFANGSRPVRRMVSGEYGV